MYSIERVAHSVRFNRKETDGLTSLKINYLISQFAAGMISIFGVLFVYQLGSDFNQGLTYVLLYFGLQRVVVITIAIPTVAALISRIGYRWAMLIGLLLLIASAFLLAVVAKGVLWPLLPSLVLGGFAIAFYYLAFHAVFLDDNDDARIGEQMGMITMLGRLALIASPIVAGLLVEYFGFSTMFIVASILLLISVIPLMLMKHHKRHLGNYSFSAVIRFIRRRGNITSAMISWSFTEAIQAFFWPIYLFMILKSYLVFGMVGSVVMIANSIIVYFVGKAYDKQVHKKYFVGSSVAVSLTWVARFLSTTPITVVLSDVLNRLFSPFWWMKIRRSELVAGEKTDSLVFGAAHEYMVSIGLILGIFVGYIVLVVGSWWLLISALAVIATMIGTWALKDE